MRQNSYRPGVNVLVYIGESFFSPRSPTDVRRIGFVYRSAVDTSFQNSYKTTKNFIVLILRITLDIHAEANINIPLTLCTRNEMWMDVFSALENRFFYISQ